MAHRAAAAQRQALGSGLASLLQRPATLAAETQDHPARKLDIPETIAEREAASPPEISPAPPPPEPEPAPVTPAAEEVPQAGRIFVEDAELLQLFIQESQDHLQTMEGKIITLETVQDPDNVNAIFRCMHTIKGNSSFLGLTEINRLSHRLESLLDGLRNKTVALSGEIIDVLLNGSDTLLAMVGSVEGARRAALETNPSATSITVDVPVVGDGGLVSRVERLLHARATGAPAAPAGAPQTPQAPAASPPAPQVPRSAPASELITDEIAQRFASETADLLDKAEEALLALERDPDAIQKVDEAFRSIHTIKGNAGFMGFTAVESGCMKVEAALEALRSGERSASAAIISALLAEIDAIRGETGARDGAASATGADKPVGEILVDLGETTREEVDRALATQERRVGEILVAEGKVSAAALERALDLQKRRSAAAEVAADRKDIRVDTGKLDKLFDLMGELITAEAMVIHNPEVLRHEVEGFSKSAAYLSKITREMQEITLTIRMIPMEGLFGKMRRLVRDLARKSGKAIELEVSGQETEMDRNVIEEISDPLVHLIRNAIDHGIEPETDRKTRGKPVVGNISLEARYEGNEIWVTVSDDGAGLNRERILAKAAERGMLTADPATLSDQEVWAYIFEPGFSTAARVSEVSGRGVGMDVVKRNMDKLRGKVDVSSQSGRGTRITLRIPLTLAIIDGVSVRVGSLSYEIPLADVVIFHKPTAAELTRTAEGREVIRLRGALIPVIKLCEFYHTPGARQSTPEGILLVTERGGKQAALLADEIVGYQQIVVKALPEYLRGMRAISGCSILGNGEVSLIIDTGALIEAELQ